MPIRFRFTQEKNIGARIIQYWTGGEWNHVECALPDGGYLGARPFALPYRGTIIPSGVQIRPHDYTKPEREAFATVDTSDYISTIILGALTSQIGKGYDWQAIAGFPLDRNWREPGHWICSELCAWAFEVADRPLLNPRVSVNRLSPRDISLSPYVRFE